MSGNSSIEWTDATWNPVTGCSKVSPGCAHCYAETISLRFGHSKKPWTPENAVENVVLHPERLDQPLRWKRPRMVFVNSMSDLFHEQVPDEFIDSVYDVMARTPQHTYQVLTKRPERMLTFFTEREDTPEVHEEERNYLRPQLPNVWLGVSIENRQFVHRADVLRETPAAVRFISAEPLLGPLDGLDLTDIDWLIVGGESGAGHRFMDGDWVRDLRDACIYRRCTLCNGLSRSCRSCTGGNRDDSPAFFFKQWGGRTPKAGGRELDCRTWDEMPLAAGERAA